MSGSSIPFQSVEKKLKYFLEKRKALLQTPGLKLRVYLRGKKEIDLNYGKVYPLYDVASLTKVAFTLEAFVQSWLRKEWDLSSRVGDFLPWVRSLPLEAKNLKVEQLLCHSSGLPAWRPFYHALLKCSGDSFFYRWTFLSSLLRKELLAKKLSRSGSGPSSTYPAVYSDVGFLLLGFILEVLYDRPLWGVWDGLEQVRGGTLKQDSFKGNGLKWNPLGRGWHFCPYGTPPTHRYLYAPTRKCPWQKKTLQGEVDDENTRALGGIAPHAGLFGSMEDMSRLGLLWRRRFHEEASSLAPFFCRRRRTDWSLGWMFPSPQGASCGGFLSPQSFGHTSFTGPSLWYDPKKDLLILILSHRVHLSHSKVKDRQGHRGKATHQRTYFRLRASLHDEVVKVLQV